MTALRRQIALINLMTAKERQLDLPQASVSAHVAGPG